MGRLWPGVFGAVLALALLPPPAHAQGRTSQERTSQPRTCRQVLPSDFRRIVNTRGEEIVYFRDPVRFLCTGDVRLESDSAVVNRAASAVELIGRVVYRDSTRELRSHWANYLGRLDQLLARDSVVLRDREGGAVIRGGQLNYLRDTPDRPVARMIVTGQRPSAVIPPRRPDSTRPAGSDRPPGPDRPPPRAPVVDTAVGVALPTDTAVAPPGDTAAEPMRVWADRMELEGEDVFRGQGDVELERGDMAGNGQTVVFDQAAERVTLTGSASIWNDDYRLEGDRIDAFLEGEGLREVRSEEDARLTSEELNVFAEQLRIGFVDGELRRLEAWNPSSAEGGPRARAEARELRLLADSIDAQADSVGIRELRAVGRAYGERQIADDAETVRAARATLPPAIARDWIQGDTILGFFSHTPVESDTLIVASPVAVDAPEPSTEDSTRAVLERLVVVGGDGPALSLYRRAPAEGAERTALNFMKASRIILFMEQGEVERVEAEGPIEGLYLDPDDQAIEGAEARPPDGERPPGAGGAQARGR